MIDHVNAYALVVRDVRKCAEFYRDKIGFQLKELSDDFAYLAPGAKGGPGVALVARTGFEAELVEAPDPSTGTDRYRSYFAVFLDDCDQEYARLKGNGVHFITPPTTRPGGQRFAFFEDPEGHLWEISHFPKA